MPNTPRQSTPLVLGATLASLLLVSGCSTINDALGGDKVDYRTSGAKTVRLDVPPDLSQLPGQVRYNQLPAASISASTLTRAEAAASSGQTAVAVATKGGVKLERQGQNRWLVVDQPADKVWNQISKFWEDNGFSLAVNQPEVGVMETTWAENRAKVPKDGLIRQTLGRVFDMLYDTGERDMYRTRIERTANGTEVYVSHRGMSEEYEDSKKERTTWRARPSDPGLEAEMLSRMMILLGSTQEEADALKRDAVQAATPAATAGRAKGNATSRMRRDSGAPSRRAASINWLARSLKAVRASKYTYGYSENVNTQAAPAVLRTSGNTRPCRPSTSRTQP